MWMGSVLKSNGTVRPKDLVHYIIDMLRNQGLWDKVDTITEILTHCALRFIIKINPHKDTRLSYTLHNVADRYDKNPEGTWE